MQPYENSNGLFHRFLKKLTLKFIWNFKEPEITKTILRNNKFKGLRLPDFKTY